MKRKFHKLFSLTISFIIIGSLIMPSNVFGFFEAGSQTAPKFLQQTVPETSLVKVVNVENKTSVIVNQPVSNSAPEIISQTVCNTQNSSKGLLQGSIGIKLQQPADCFTLIGVIKPSNVEGLSVRPLVQNQTVSVIVEPAKISAFGFLPFSPFVQNQAVIPITVSLALLAGLAIIRKIKEGNKKALFARLSNHSDLSLSRLQVFRC